MSALVHCDGPDCEQTRDVDSIANRAMFEGGWLRVSQGDGVRKLDFHSQACLTAWSKLSDTSTTATVDGR